MSPVDRLQSLLQGIASHPVKFDANAATRLLAAQNQGLERWIRNGGARRPPSPDSTAEAVSRFCGQRRFDSFADARRVCFGFTDAIGAQGYRLIEDSRTFPLFLQSIAVFRGKPRRFRRCYRGLLDGYLRYDPSAKDTPASGQRNWVALRDQLRDWIADIQSEGIAPDWVGAILRHPALLTDAAGREFARTGHDIATEPFDAMCSELAVPDTSWLVRKFIMERIDAGIAQADSVFRGLLPAFFRLIEAHRFVLGEALARLLTRYRQCASTDLHAGLRDFSVRHWGNPWCPANADSWRRVEDATRAMIGSWLKRELMEKFFGLLVQGGANDARRLRFWLRYLDHIEDMHFVLGSAAYTSASPEFRNLRLQMRGRLLPLRDLNPLNNAFVMMMRDYAFVEFGLGGNSCFIFKRSDGLPFALDKRTGVLLFDLKHPSRVTRLPHEDRRGEDWERSFEQAIEGLTSLNTGAPIVPEGRRHSPSSSQSRSP